MRRIALSLLAALLLVAGVAHAFTPPPIQGYVTDAAGKLSAEEVRVLDDKLASLRRCSSDQIAVFVARSLEGGTIEDIGHATATAWKLGEAGKDNGVLLVIAPAERKVRIEVGRGLEGQLTDLEANDVLREHVSPNLKKDDFFAAVDDGTSAIGAALWKTGPHASCASLPHATRPGASSSARPSPSSSPSSSPSRDAQRMPTPLVFALIGSFLALFALTFTPKDGIFRALFSFFIALVGAFPLAFVCPMLTGSDLASAVGPFALTLVIVVIRVWLARRPKPAHVTSRSASAAAATTASSYDASSTVSSGSSSWSSGGSSGSSWSSSGGSSSNDSGFSGGGGGSFGGGGSSDSY